jgi:hypothetical protein
MMQHITKLFAIIILFASCKLRNDTAQIATVIQSLQNANSVILEYNNRLHLTFDQRSKDPAFSSWNLKWLPKTEKIKKLSSLMNLYIDSCINSLKTGEKSEIATHSFYLKLLNYKRDLVNVLDPEEYQHIPVYREQIINKKKDLFAVIPLLSYIDDTSTAAIRDLNEKRWRDNTFSNADLAMQDLMLHKIKNDVLISEQILLDFCFRSSTDHNPHHYDEIKIITSLSSSTVKSGDPLEVTAGIAIVNDLLKPRVTIGGKKVRLTGMGLTEYTFQPQGKPGKYTLPVIIEITKPDGSIDKYQKKLNYTILP